MNFLKLNQLAQFPEISKIGQGMIYSLDMAFYLDHLYQFIDYCLLCVQWQVFRIYIQGHLTIHIRLLVLAMRA